MARRLQDKLALITGAANGIGAAVARAYAQAGARLILLDCDLEGLERSDDRCKALGAAVTLVQLDLQEGAKIDALGVEVAGRFGRLDILVGNAAVLGVLGPTAHMEPKVWEQVMAVNVNANWRLLHAFDALLQKSPMGRAIFTTSYITEHVKAYWSAYATSKVALNRLVQTYATETQNIAPNLRVNLVDPGIVRTKLRAEAMPGEDPQTLPAPEDVVDVFVELAVPNCQQHGEVIRVGHKAV
ncbi:MAG: SDR family NAD(P)-dependent oxidoreductase [Pseudomonadota bacterium]